MIRPALLCDTCPTVFTAERRLCSNSELTRQATAAGWASTKDETGHWSNTCDECTTNRKATP